MSEYSQEASSERRVMTDEKTCCGVLEQLEAEYGGPIERPISFDLKTGEVKADSWAIHLYHLTKSGAISKKSAPFVFFTYCPFCSKRIRDDV